MTDGAYRDPHVTNQVMVPNPAEVIWKMRGSG